MENETVSFYTSTPAIDLNPQVDSLSTTSLGLSWSSPPSLSIAATYFNIDCNSSSSSTLITNDLYLSQSHCISYKYLANNSTNRISVTGLMASTNYTCCVTADVENSGNSTGCVDILTLKESMGAAGLSNAIAGVVGGVIVMIIMLIILTLAGAVVLSVLYTRKWRFSG